MIGLEFSN